ncbi:MAG: hypothetical protein KF726_20760 [Anaerolineae bacterium]|nr:hypothetical protein [Anaerolineae bacterium]
MRNLIRLTILTLALLTTAVGGSRAFGQRHQVFTLADWLLDSAGKPCAEPCILGIRPGVTSFDEALHLLQIHPLTHDLTMYTANRVEVMFLGDDVRIGVVEDSDGLVYSIHLEPQRRDISSVPAGAPTLRLTLGELVNVLGAPDAFQLRQTRTGPVNIATYFAHNLTIINYRRTGEVSPYDPFIYIFMYRQDSASVYQPDVAASWRGFGMARMYFRNR